MARQGIFTGSSPNDGTGDSLLVGASKVNQNFSEIYSVFGNGNTLVSYASSSGISTVSQGLTGTPNITVGVSTATSFRSNSTVGNGTDIGFAIRYYVTASGSASYRFAGPGLVNTTDNPAFYLHRGFTYIFENSTGGSHPFAIRYSSGGTGYGSTYLSGSQSGTQIFTVPFDAPATLVYQCTIHSGMLGTFNIVT